MAELLKVIDSRHELKCLHPVARNGIKKTEELVKLFSRTERNNRFVSALDVLVFFSASWMTSWEIRIGLLNVV